MNSRGFTTVELLVAATVLLIIAGLVTAAVRLQVRHAGSQVRLATLQQDTRAAFDLLARDLRMAGYGVELSMPGVPAPISENQSDLLLLYANFTNVKTSGSGAGSTVTVTDATGFAADNYLVIKSVWGGEARKITGVGNNTIQLAQPLSRVYPPGSEVSQIEYVRYELARGAVLRNGQPMADGVQQLNFQYFLQDGTLVSDPTGVERDIRSALVSIRTDALDQPTGAQDENMALQSEVRIRNLGLVAVDRSP